MMLNMKKSTVFELASAAIFAALLSVLAPLTVPIGPIPVTLATFILYLSVYVLRLRSALSACGVYLLFGAFGLPVFTGYAGGIAKIAGPTGGYLIGYIFLTLIAGLLVRNSQRFEKKSLSIAFSVLGLILGTAALYLFGTAWFMIQAKASLSYALSVCVIPFIPVDLGKIILATILGRLLQRALRKAGLLSPEGNG